ncbi:MAG: hypothetical protein PHO37_02245 [Kiritimatiellae bacterium]|nr:hypothetical protein [Kiritimatiellia bacterium]
MKNIKSDCALMSVNLISKGMTWVVAALFIMATHSVTAAIQSPTELGGCVLWLDAADTASLIEANGRVSEWRDKSGNSAHMAQSDAAKRPITAQASQNGRNTLYFDGARWLGGPAVLQQGDDTFSYFILWNRNDYSGARTVFEQADSGGATGTRAALLTIGSSKKYGFNGQGNDSHLLAPYATNEWMLSGMEIDGRADRNVVLYSNQDYYVGTINMDTQQTGATGTRVGCKLVNGAETMKGWIAEIIVFDCVLSDIDRNSVLYYLQEKWGLECGYQDYAMLIDFEHDRFPEGWVTDGAAFATQPVNSTRYNFNKNGDWFVSTYVDSKDGGTTSQGDGLIGSVTGTPFVLSNNTVRARVAGGHRYVAGSELQLQLERRIDENSWQVIRKASGCESNAMRENCWNVHNLIGEVVRFRIVDFYSGTWGQIVVDDIRVMDEPMPRSLSTSFDSGGLPSGLHIQRPFSNPVVEVTTNNTLRLALLSNTHDIWSAHDKGPKVLLNTVDDDAFVLETRMVSRSYTNSVIAHHTGLILMFEEPDANTFDPVMFGPYCNAGLCLEGPGTSSRPKFLSGDISDIWLRVEGRLDRFTFRYSFDGELWHTVQTEYYPGKVLMHAGLFCKDWEAVSGLEVEYDYFSYTAEPIPLGSLLMVR